MSAERDPAFAENCGAEGYRVDSPDDLDGALEAALSADGPALVEILTDAAPV